MFKPMLATNDQIDLDEIPYPQMASIKLDGIRCIFKQGKMLSRKFKEIQNKQLQKKFEFLKKWSKDNPNRVLDGELYTHDIPFPELSGIVRQKDCDPKGIRYHIFDLYSTEKQFPFIERNNQLNSFTDMFFGQPIHPVQQWMVSSPNEVRKLYKEVLNKGYEGLMLKNPEGKYKCGRTTVRENLMYKVKPYQTFDRVILGIVQATEVNKDAPKKKNELGRSVTSKKKGDRHLIPKACSFTVPFGQHKLDVSIALSDSYKKYIWENQEKYLGKYIEFKGLMIGAKDLPRHPVFLRFREDKD